MTLPLQRGSVSMTQLLVGSMMILGLLASVNWLQGRFNSSDKRKAVRMVSDYKSKSGIPLTDALLRAHPRQSKEDILFSSEIRQSCLGYVRVEAKVPGEENQKAVSYFFDVDLNGPSVHPTDPVTVKILKSLSSTVSL